jgi:hypothetical protein
VSEPLTEPTEPTEPEGEPTEPSEPVEPDTPSEPGQDEPPAPEVPVTPQGPTPEAVEKAYRAVESSFKTYSRVVENRLDFLADALVPCPCCNPSHPGYFNVHDAGRLPEANVEATMQLLGLARPVDYEPDERAHQCSKCKGLGKTKTGSRVPGNESMTCRECRGYGFVPPPDTTHVANGAAADVFAPAGDQAHAVEEGDRDVWGEPRILPDGRQNPNYGKLPQHKIPVPPYGITAQLTVQDAVAGA